MQTVKSADGTVLAYDKEGNGPAVVIVGAGPTDRSGNAALVELLAPRLTVLNYDPPRAR